MIGRTRFASLCALVLLLAANGARTAIARRLNDITAADNADSDIAFRQAVITPRPLTERVFYNPNRGELGKVEDYVTNVYIGDIYFAFADPVGAGVGSAVRRWVPHHQLASCRPHRQFIGKTYMAYSCVCLPVQPYILGRQF